MTAHGRAPPPFCTMVALAVETRLTLVLPKILAKKVWA